MAQNSYRYCILNAYDCTRNHSYHIAGNSGKHLD